MIFRPFPLIALCLAAYAAADGQDRVLTFEHYTIDDGLSNNVVTAVSQDRYGFLWVGTEDGLNRFDGYTFTSYKHNPSDPSSISSSVVYSLCVDSAGRQWIGTSAGLDRYDPGQDAFIHFDHDSDSTFNAGKGIRFLCAARNGVLWVGCQSGGLLRYDPGSRHLDRFRFRAGDSTGIPGDTVDCLFTAGDGKVWLSCRGTGLTVFDPAKNAFRSFVIPENEPGTSAPLVITSIAQDQIGLIWFTTYGSGIGRLDPHKGSSRLVHHSPGDPRSPGDDYASAALVDRSGVLWIATIAQGIECCDPLRATFTHYPHDPTNPRSVNSPRIYALFEDRRGSLWAGTWQGGVNVYHPWRQKFSHIMHVPGQTNSLSNDTVWALCEDANRRVWVGTENGLDMKAAGEAAIVHFRHDRNRPPSIGGNFIRAILQDHAGFLWFGLADGGLDRYDEARRVFQHYRHDPGVSTSLSSNNVTALCEDSMRRLWVGTSEGVLNELARSTGRVHAFPVKDLSGVSGVGNDIEAIVDDQRGKLWIASFGGGLFRFDPTTDSFEAFARRAPGKRSFPTLGILSLALDDRGDLWIGTFANGLSHYVMEKDTFETLTERDGLASNYIKAIVPDDHGNLWLSSIKGITRFTIATRKVKNFGLSDGIQSNEFRTGSLCRGRDGRIYFGGVHGFNVFQPDSIRDNPLAPDIVLTQFKVFDEPLRFGRMLADVPVVDLSYTQNFFSIDFVGLDFTVSAKNQYAYQLQGFDRDWVACGTRRFANYTHLDGGEYVFRVRGSNNDGVWNVNGATLRIVIHPPFWSTWWFRVLLVAIVAGASVALARIRFRRLLAVEQTRSRIARDLHDELSATLSGINFFAQAIARDGDNALTAKSGRFLSLIHESAASLQESVSDIIWSVNPGQDHWESIIAKWRRYASDLLDSKAIGYTFDLPAEMPAKAVTMERRRNVWLMYKEIIVNAAKHSHCRHLTISLRLDGSHWVELRIIDDGKGFDPTLSGGGNGVNNIRSRAAMIGAFVDVHSVPGSGTRWTLRFPA